MVADWVIHAKDGNPHAHVMLTMQPMSDDGFASRYVPAVDEAGNPVRMPNGKIKYHLWDGNKDTLRAWRRQWSEVANRHLELRGYDARIDHRSLKERGSSLTPNRHHGPKLSALLTNGWATYASAERERQRAENAARITADPREAIRLLSSQKSVFTADDVARVVARYVDDRDEVRRIASEAVSASDVLSTTAQVLDQKSGRMVQRTVYALCEMIDLERGMLADAKALRLEKGHGVDDKRVRAAIGDLENRLAVEHALRVDTAYSAGRISADERQAQIAQFSGLAEEQKAAIRHVTGEQGISVVVGFAGAGKSTMLEAARRAWEAQGARVFGASLSGKATEGLQESAGIASRTLASWQLAWENGQHRLQAGDMFVIDEAGMVSSRQLAHFVSEVRAAGAKVVLVGDAMQLQPIEAGAAFRAIGERVGYLELEGIRRQKHDWMREASVDLARGRVTEALRRYDEQGAVRFADDRDGARAAIVDAWMTAREQGSVLILAHANADVHALNAGVRAARLAAGELTDAVTVQTDRGQREFAVGDRVLFLKNEADVKNGMLATVTAIQSDKLVVRIDGSSDEKTIDPRAYGYFDHGYAATVHKSQGATVDRTLVLASGTMDQHLAYVAMTRHREEAVLFADREQFASLAELSQKLGRDGGASTTLDYAWSAGERPEGLSIWQHFQLSMGLKGKPIVTEAPAQSATVETAAMRPESNGVPSPEAKPEMKARRADARPLIPAVSHFAGAVEEVAVTRAEANPAYWKAREQMIRAAEGVWRNPVTVAKGLEARYRAGEDAAELSKSVAANPGAFGALHGSDGALARFTEAGRLRRAAQQDAGFVAQQVERAGTTWRTTVDTERATEALRRERMVHAVPQLSDRAQGLLRSLEEARSKSEAHYQAAVARAAARADLLQEVSAYSDALSKRFGPEAFKPGASARLDAFLEEGDHRALSRVRETAEPAQRFAATAERFTAAAKRQGVGLDDHLGVVAKAADRAIEAAEAARVEQARREAQGMAQNRAGLTEQQQAKTVVPPAADVDANRAFTKRPEDGSGQQPQGAGAETRQVLREMRANHDRLLAAVASGQGLEEYSTEQIAAAKRQLEAEKVAELRKEQALREGREPGRGLRR